MLRASVLGASGYVGAELIRLLSSHPRFAIGELVAHSHAGAPVASVLPSTMQLFTGVFSEFDAERVAQNSDIVFAALPHRAAATTVAALRRHNVVVVDLSADFRLRSAADYRLWYGEPHPCPELLPGAVYGLAELYRKELRTADLIANPGCFPTATLLAIAPLVRAGVVEFDSIVIDAKSGVSGAGRKPSERTHFPEAAEGVRGYQVAGKHRHTAEIEQTLTTLAGVEVRVSFTPHLVPMVRGLLSTVHARLRAPITAHECRELARSMYQDSPSVRVFEEPADTAWVRGSNFAAISYHVDERTGRVVAMGAIDNLLKGAASQAVQCANVRFGLAEGAGIDSLPVWP